MSNDGRLSDIVWQRHPNLYAAAQQAILTKQDTNNINAYAWLVRKHDELTELPVRDRTKAYNALEPDVQQALKKYFETDYSYEEAPKSAFKKIRDFVLDIPKNAIGGAFTLAEKYSEQISKPYIASRTDYSWSDSFDGERIFDTVEEERLRSILSPEVFNIARRAAMGDSPGEILSDLETDEQFAAFEKYRSKDNEEFRDAIQMFKNSKISAGRDFARNVLNLKTDDGLLFKLTSGSADLFYQIVGDPLTYATGGLGKGLQLGGVGIVRGSRAISSILDGSRDVDDLFLKSSVRRYWDKAGQNIKDLADPSKATDARFNIQRNFPELDNSEFISLLRKDKVFDANAANQFFKGAQNLEYLLKGQIRVDRAVMPVWGWGKELRSNFKSVIDNVFYGSEKTIPVLKTLTEAEDSLIKSGESFGDPSALEEIPPVVKLARERRGVLEKFANLFERAPVVSGIRILNKEITDAQGEKQVIDEFVQSSDDIYKLARTVYNRREANVVRLAFENADTAQRYLMLRGLYVQIGQNMGLNDTIEGRNFLSTVMKTQFDNAYTESVKLSDNTIENIAKDNPQLAELIRQNDGYWKPTATENGVSSAAVHWQVAGQIGVPRFDIWARQARTQKGAAVKYLGGALDSRLHDTTSQAWTLLTLFPRNGMRGAIDEMLTFGLTAPLTSILKFRKGRALSRAYRETQDPKRRNLLLYQQFTRATFLKDKNVTPETYAKILDDPTGQTLKRVILEQYAKEAKFNFNGGIDNDLDNKHITSAIENGVFFDNLPYVQGATTKGFSNSNPNISLRDENVIGEKAVIELNIERVLEDVRDRAGLVQSKSKMGGGLYTNKPQMTALVRGKENEYNFQWSEQIFFRVANDPRGAQIFFENLDDFSRAISLMAEYYSKNPKILNQLKIRNAPKGVDPIKDAAEYHVMHLASVFFGRDGNVLPAVKDNLKNIIVKDPETNKNKLNLKWFEDNLDYIPKNTPFDLAPSQLLANVYEYKGLSNTPGEVIQKFQDGAWGIMDNQASMMFREPAYFANFLWTRKKLVGAEKQMVKRLVSNGTDADMAAKLADEHFTNLSGKLAMERTVAYIDNPMVRSNLAFMVRNFARFFRATEDFYRRYGRAFKNDPQSILRLRLATQGLSGSGFIHRTDDDEDYFIIPGDSWMWTVTSDIYKGLTGQEMLAINPIEFGVKINMISPSLDPDSALPSFAGPLAAVPIKGISKLLGTSLMVENIPGGGSLKRGFDKYSLGVYSENSTLGDAILPGSLRKIRNALTPNETNSQFTSAAMQAMLYAASNPNIKTPTGSSSFMEKQEFMAQIRATAANILFIRNAVGLIAPAGLSTMETKDVPDYIKEAGFSNMSREFFKLREKVVEKYGAGEASWSEALLKWTYNDQNLGRLIYTVPRTERSEDEVVKLQTTKEAADWVAGNPSLVKKYPQAAMLFAPQIGEFDIGAYSFLKLNGYIKVKELDQFLTDINTTQNKRTYFQLGRLYEDRIMRSSDLNVKSFYRDELQKIRRTMRDNNPELDRALSDYSFSTAKEDAAIDQLRSLLKDPMVPKGIMSSRLALMLQRYDANRESYNYAIANGLSSERKQLINIGGLGDLEAVAGKDKNLLLAIDSLFAPILER